MRSSYLKVQVVGCLVYPVGRARASLCSDSLHCASVCEPCFVLFFSRHFFLTCECFCCPVLCACMCVCACTFSVIIALFICRAAEARLLCRKPCSLTTHSSSFPSPILRNRSARGGAGTRTFNEGGLFRDRLFCSQRSLLRELEEHSVVSKICGRMKPDAVGILPAGNPEWRGMAFSNVHLIRNNEIIFCSSRAALIEFNLHLLTAK